MVVRLLPWATALGGWLQINALLLLLVAAVMEGPPLWRALRRRLYRRRLGRCRVRPMALGRRARADDWRAMTIEGPDKATIVECLLYHDGLSRGP